MHSAAKLRMPKHAGIEHFIFLQHLTVWLITRCDYILSRITLVNSTLLEKALTSWESMSQTVLSIGGFKQIESVLALSCIRKCHARLCIIVLCTLFCNICTVCTDACCHLGSWLGWGECMSVHPLCCLCICSCPAPPSFCVFKLGRCRVAFSAPVTVAQRWKKVFWHLDPDLVGVVMILFQRTELLSFRFVLVCVCIKLVHLKSL